MVDVMTREGSPLMTTKEMERDSGKLPEERLFQESEKIQMQMAEKRITWKPMWRVE